MNIVKKFNRSSGRSHWQMWLSYVLKKCAVSS